MNSRDCVPKAIHMSNITDPRGEYLVHGEMYTDGEGGLHGLCQRLLDYP